jgi:hypothetical protein
MQVDNNKKTTYLSDRDKEATPIAPAITSKKFKSFPLPALQQAQNCRSSHYSEPPFLPRSECGSQIAIQGHRQVAMEYPIT